MHAIFSKRYEYPDSLTGITRTVPAGWQGNTLPDEVVQAAVAGGYATSADAASAARDSEEAAKPSRKGKSAE